MTKINVMSNSDLSVSLAQGYNADFMSGERSTLDVSLIHSLKEVFNISVFDISINSRLAIGVRYDKSSKLDKSYILPTDNEVFGESVVKYPAGLLIDPYISANARTQVTESMLIANKKKFKTAKFWDPITTQQSFGLAYSIKDSLLKNDIRIGLSLMQIRADLYTTLTNDPRTFHIKEKYKSKTGIDINNTLSYRIDKSATLTTKLSLFGDIENLDIWLVRFENDLNLMIWGYLGLIIRMNLFYDHNQMKKIQIQQSFRIGFITKI
ncbi:MAG: hypothetical protein KIT33_13205 [Candidatus Kapabacteria bacterium]|nr:hypothetical protein [Ignavibacteriota bacterium]MCW5885921.1 hypothetical protein [Candidatus Kapabacteria bacterium]